MFRHRLAIVLGALTLIGAGEQTRAQRPGGGMMGMGGGMMGMRHDSATMAQMAVIHDMVLNHERITRAVTNLPDGIRTVTESDDPQMSQRIREHVATMYARVAAGDDPGLPIESAALRTIYRNGDRISTVLDTSSRGVIVTQTSRDSVTVAALQTHAAEVTELVRDGMSAMHRAMMKNGAGMMGRGMSGRNPSP